VRGLDAATIAAQPEEFLRSSINLESATSSPRRPLALGEEWSVSHHEKGMKGGTTDTKTTTTKKAASTKKK